MIGDSYAGCAGACRKAGGRLSPKGMRPSDWVTMPVRASHASNACLLSTSDAYDDLHCLELDGRSMIQKIRHNHLQKVSKLT
ncbi:hypothetical protein, partial [Pseudomonas parafulva]|uniref:hypothetical protein n=1 Tax=Pseudomonas parafulva TaxID=157782 RepID=UPI0019D34BD6